MALIADGLLLLAAAVAALYCYVLSRRLERLNALEGGLGKAITALSDRVDMMSAALELAKTSTESAATQLRGKTAEAEVEVKRLTKLIESAKAAHAALTFVDEAARKAEGKRAEPAPAPEKAAESAPAPTAAAAEAPPAAAVAASPPAAEVETPAAEVETPAPAETAPETAAAQPLDAELVLAAARSLAAAAEPQPATRPAKRSRSKAPAAKPAARRRSAKAKAPAAETDLASEIGSIIAEGRAGDKDAMLRRLIAALGDKPTTSKEHAA